MDAGVSGTHAGLGGSGPRGIQRKWAEAGLRKSCDPAHRSTASGQILGEFRETFHLMKKSCQTQHIHHSAHPSEAALTRTHSGVESTLKIYSTP